VRGGEVEEREQLPFVPAQRGRATEQDVRAAPTAIVGTALVSRSGMCSRAAALQTLLHGALCAIAVTE
jgi:hypothetical protein